MFQNFYCYEIYFGFLSFLNPVSKTFSVCLTYEKTLKFCVVGIFSFNFEEILWVIMDETITIIIIIITCHFHCY